MSATTITIISIVITMLNLGTTIFWICRILHLRKAQKQVERKIFERRTYSSQALIFGHRSSEDSPTDNEVNDD